MQAGLAYLAAVLVALWGFAHVAPTFRVLAAFEPIAPDNRRTSLQEWVAEATTMWGLATIVITATVADGGSSVTAWMYQVNIVAGCAERVAPLRDALS